VQGRVRCVCGKDNVTADKGPWDVLSERALSTTIERTDTHAAIGSAHRLRVAQPYLPDFSAFALTPSVRCLSIEVADVERICARGTLATNGTRLSPYRMTQNEQSDGTQPSTAAVTSNLLAHAVTAQVPAPGTRVMDRVHLLTEVGVDIPDLSTLSPVR
jgi:hypothetical protein